MSDVRTQDHAFSASGSATVAVDAMLAIAGAMMSANSLLAIGEHGAVFTNTPLARTRLWSGPAHGQHGEAIAGDIERGDCERCPIAAGHLSLAPYEPLALVQIALVQIWTSDKGIDVAYNVLVVLLERLRDLAAIGEHGAVLHEHAFGPVQPMARRVKPSRVMSKAGCVRPYASRADVGTNQDLPNLGGSPSR